MDTPICDFAAKYRDSGAVRLHMPGHKGKAFLGCEDTDITEINGADSLYDASGVIARSEKNASDIFGARTFYVTEGSSQSIRAMMQLAVLNAQNQAIRGARPLIAAGRNAHKAFLSACALLDLDIMWLGKSENYLSCSVTAQELETALRSAPRQPSAVYITSPDYLGNTADISALAKVCRAHGILMAVDNAHGSYLKLFGRHPIELGADMCCDSAHKTLPVLTGGGYLHISDSAVCIAKNAKSALELFGSTSPSYLILQSLDRANKYLSEAGQAMRSFALEVQNLRDELICCGYGTVGNEPLKITIVAKKYGYTGIQLAAEMEKNNIFCEFADPDYIVMMFTPQNGSEALAAALSVLKGLPRRAEIKTRPPLPERTAQIMTVRQAMLSPRETVDIEKACGRVLGSPSVGCPPAVPIAVCGEVINESHIAAFRYYGIEKIGVVK